MTKDQFINQLNTFINARMTGDRELIQFAGDKFDKSLRELFDQLDALQSQVATQAQTQAISAQPKPKSPKR